ncbi:hypothetical protein [Rhizobium grahamii]|uniref:MOSC domain-containing protein n=2 Tax=Rhizobium grahamii TaxID=1120045 RepID=S3HEP5_9HYPH|nr:hypothetical protein [Rhizobium grahamii]EPE97194.1 hypothetical protein RGCCGE502_16550 [Rhizobium grahamii CCGE 502]RDJ02297.1 hypothetical protein B5K06_32395 [Rhizobium grahamii]
MAQLLSLNVGLLRNIPWRGQVVSTAIWKEPVKGPRMVRRLNINGDGQGDTAGHGGENRAVFVYQIDFIPRNLARANPRRPVSLKDMCALHMPRRA